MPDYLTYSDLQLIECLNNNDEAAFTELYNRYWDKLYRSAFIKLNDREAAKEIVHDVFIDIWRRRAALSIGFLPAYLEQAVRFKVINTVSRKKNIDFAELFETVLHSPFNADNQVNIQDFLKVVEGWIAILPAKQRKIFVKYYFENLTTQEIALEMNLSAKTVQNNLSLTTQYIRRNFKDLLILLIMLSTGAR